MKIITINGVSQSGKDTLAKIIQYVLWTQGAYTTESFDTFMQTSPVLREAWTTTSIMRFGDAPKRALGAMYPLEFSHKEWEENMSYRDENFPSFGQTRRQVLNKFSQTAKLVDEFIWVRPITSQLTEIFKKSFGVEPVVIIPDERFFCEREIMNAWDTIKFRVVRYPKTILESRSGDTEPSEIPFDISNEVHRNLHLGENINLGIHTELDDAEVDYNIDNNADYLHLIDQIIPILAAQNLIPNDTTD